MKTVKLAMVLGSVTMLSACLAGDPNTFTATPEQMADAMIGKSSTYMRKQYKHTMRVTGGSPKGVNVALSADGGRVTTCRIRFEAVDETTTRIVPDCGKAKSAIAKSRIDFTRVKVLEQAKHILTGEPVDVAFLESAQMTHAMKNLPKMQGEAIAMDRQMRQMQKEYAQGKRETARAAEGWGSE